MPGNTVVNGNKDHDSALRTHEDFRTIKQLGKVLSDTQLSGLAGFHWRRSILQCKTMESLPIGRFLRFVRNKMEVKIFLETFFKSLNTSTDLPP